MKLKKNFKPHRFLKFQEFIVRLNNNNYKVKSPSLQLQAIIHKRWFSGIKLRESQKLLAELYYALQIVIENISIIKIQIWLAKSFLIAFDHHKNDFLIIIRTFKEITQITLFLNFFSSFYHWVSIFYILIVIFIIPMNLKDFSTIIFHNWCFFICFFRLS